VPVLDDAEIARVRELHASLRAVKRCSDCGLPKRVTEFTSYGIPDCRECLDRARKAREQAEREAKEAAETAARHARHLAQRAASASMICPECLGSKPLHALRCRWCTGRLRVGVA
jgi:ribosomal protein L37AE/L43A